MALPAIPPLNFNSTATSSARSALDQNGQINHASGDGDWVVNMGGAQSVGLSPWVVAGAAVVAVWWFTRKK